MGFNKEDYVARISTASRLQLVIINFEIIIDYINESKNYIGTKSKEFDFNITKARQFLMQLICNLNMEYNLSYDLKNIYNFIDYELAKYLFNEKVEIANDCINILSEILNSFKYIEKNEKDKSPIMKTPTKIFAGLTYDKNGKLDEFVNTDINRGFKA